MRCLFPFPLALPLHITLRGLNPISMTVDSTGGWNTVLVRAAPCTPMRMEAVITFWNCCSCGEEGGGREGAKVNEKSACAGEIEKGVSHYSLSLLPAIPPPPSSLPTSVMSSIRTASTFFSPPSSRKTRAISSKLLVLLSSNKREAARSISRM